MYYLLPTLTILRVRLRNMQLWCIRETRTNFRVRIYGEPSASPELIEYRKKKKKTLIFICQNQIYIDFLSEIVRSRGFRSNNRDKRVRFEKIHMYNNDFTVLGL